VVIGILIALQIDNWNEERKEARELAEIHERVVLDLEDDIGELAQNLNYWKVRQPVFQKVIEDSITAELLDQGLSRLLTSPTRTNFNKAGILQLKASNSKDELSLRVIEAYDWMENITLMPTEEQMIKKSNELVDHFQQSYSWFPEWMGKTIMKDNSSKELQDYFLNNPEYRNYVIRGNQIVYNNYVVFLEMILPRLQKLRNELKAKSNPEYNRLNKAYLEQYAGEYKIVEKEGFEFGLPIGTTQTINALDQVIRLMGSNTSDPYFDFLYAGADTFSFKHPRYRLDLIFERNDSLQVERIKAVLKRDQGDQGMHYWEKQ
jgi:hypothetical protein